MDILPPELINLITYNLKHFTDTSSLKQVCKDFNYLISKTLLIKLKLSHQLSIQNKKKIKRCININCCKDTEEIFLYDFLHFLEFFLQD